MLWRSSKKRPDEFDRNNPAVELASKMILGASSRCLSRARDSVLEDRRIRMHTAAIPSLISDVPSIVVALSSSAVGGLYEVTNQSQQVGSDDQGRAAHDLARSKIDHEPRHPKPISKLKVRREDRLMDLSPRLCGSIPGLFVERFRGTL